MEVELEEVIISIFTNPPGETNSYPISFDTNNLKQLFESLLIIFTNGMKILFGNQNGVVELGNLSENDIILVRDYFSSMGFIFYFDIYDDSNENRDKTQKMKYTNLNLNNNYRLKDLFFPLLSKEKIYLINFDYI
mgnify:CR=1 FL=1|tara:strand:- start:1827 stop:2231 length:405 start_codon:yes stop_codon:yes gene_type:complete